MSSNRDKRGASRDSRERSLYKRDTILMICALLILFLSPFAISIYSNYQESMQMEQRENFSKKISCVFLFFFIRKIKGRYYHLFLFKKCC